MSSKCSFTCICGIVLPLEPSATTVYNYARSAFYPNLRFTLSLQSAFYTQSAFYSWSAVCSPQSAFYTDRFIKAIENFFPAFAQPDINTRVVGRILDSYANPRLRLGLAYINCLEFSQPLFCFFQAMQTRKTFSIA